MLDRLEAARTHIGGWGVVLESGQKQNKIASCKLSSGLPPLCPQPCPGAWQCSKVEARKAGFYTRKSWIETLPWTVTTGTWLVTSAVVPPPRERSHRKHSLELVGVISQLGEGPSVNKMPS